MSNRLIAALLLVPVAAALAATPRGPTPQPPAATGRRAVLGAATLGAAAAALAPAREALAWCGDTVPSWAFYLMWDEDSAFPFEYSGTRGQFYCRVVGDVAREKKAGVVPVLVIGTPGLGYDYMENFETLTVSDRRVVEVMFAGSAAGAAETPAALLCVGSCAAQLQAAVGALNVPAVHVIAHGLGAPAALALLRAQPKLIRSLALVSPYGTASDLKPAAAEAVRSARSSAAAGATLLQTTALFAKNSCVADAAAAGGGPLLAQLLGATGGGARLGGRALADALGGAETPVLLATGGAADIVEPDWSALPPSVTRRAFSLAGHLPFVDQREDFLIGYADFLDGADGVATNRELKFANPGTTLKELTSDRPLGAPPKDCAAFKTDAARAYCENNPWR